MVRKRREYWLPDMAWLKRPKAVYPDEGTVEYAEMRRVRPVLEGIASRHGIELEEMFRSHCGKRLNAPARDEAYYELRQFGFAWNEVTRIMGRRSKATATKAYERHWRRLQAGRIAA